MSCNYTEFARSQATPARVGPSDRETLPVAHELTYSWQYHAERTDLRALYEKSKDLGWNARTDLPWAAAVDPQGENVPDMFIPLFGSPLWDKLDPKRQIPELRQHSVSYMLSNFLHGEQGALLATSQLVACVPSQDAKLYASAQVFDEARHVEVYDRYLREKIELVYPVSHALRQLLDAILTDSRWDMKYLGMQIMVEGVALGAFGVIQQASNEPLIKQIVQKIMQDESRHVAFGVLALQDVLADLNEAERREREDFILECSHLLKERFLGDEIWERLDLPMAECRRLADESMMMQMFRKLLFSKIVPNVKRLGLLGPRLRKGFETLGVLDFEHEPASV